MIARLPGIPFSSLYFFLVNILSCIFTGTSLFMIYLTLLKYLILLLINAASVIYIWLFVTMNCLMWNTIGCITCCMFVLVPFLSEDLWNNFSLYIFWCNCLIKKIVAADRLSTGFAVADLDLSKVEAVRTRMPISEVLLLSQGSTIHLFRFQPGPEVLL